MTRWKRYSATLILAPDRNSKPYRSISDLKNFRDTIAYGKPIEDEFDEEIVAKRDEVERDINLDGEWIQYCKPDTVLEIYKNFDATWKELLAASGLQISDPITHWSSGLTLLEALTQKST